MHVRTILWIFSFNFNSIRRLCSIFLEIEQNSPIIVDEAGIECVEIEYEGERTAAKINVIHSVKERRGAWIQMNIRYQFNYSFSLEKFILLHLIWSHSGGGDIRYLTRYFSLWTRSTIILCMGSWWRWYSVKVGRRMQFGIRTKREEAAEIVDANWCWSKNYGLM